MNQPTDHDTEDRLIDYHEVSRLLGGISERTIRRLLGGISERTIRRLIAAGDLPQPVRVRRSPRLYHAEVRAYLEKLKLKRKPKPKHPFSP